MHIDTFEKFWLHYLHEHARPQTRDMHMLGTALAAIFLAAAAVSLRAPARYRPVSPVKLMLAAAATGYAPAWISHWFYGGNRPVTFRHPAWSLMADLRFAWFSATGRLGRELEIAGVETEIEDAGSRLSAGT